jgi:hypothetical protein
MAASNPKWFKITRTNATNKAIIPTNIKKQLQYIPSLIQKNAFLYSNICKNQSKNKSNNCMLFYSTK